MIKADPRAVSMVRVNPSSPQNQKGLKTELFVKLTKERKQMVRTEPVKWDTLSG